MPKHEKLKSLSRYSPLYVDVAREQFRRGATVAQVARLFGVSSRGIYYWMEEHPAFRRAVEEGREDAAAFRISQMPPLPQLFPPTEGLEARPLAAGAGSLPGPQTIVKEEKYFVEPPIRHRQGF